jgi:hypothetical protein
MPVAPGMPSMRRQSGVRREASDRVRFELQPPEGGTLVVDGWALNLSRGGVRAIIEEPIALGAELMVAVGEAPLRAGRIVWIQEEPGGAIVGVQFIDADANSDVPGPVTALPPTDAGTDEALRAARLPSDESEPSGRSGG